MKCALASICEDRTVEHTVHLTLKLISLQSTIKRFLAYRGIGTGTADVLTSGRQNRNSKSKKCLSIAETNVICMIIHDEDQKVDIYEQNKQTNVILSSQTRERDGLSEVVFG